MCLLVQPSVKMANTTPMLILWHADSLCEISKTVPAENVSINQRHGASEVWISTEVFLHNQIAQIIFQKRKHYWKLE